MTLNKRNTLSLAIINIAMAAVWLFFLHAHISTYLQTRHPVQLVFSCMAIILVVLFLIRNPPKTFSSNTKDWIVSIAGTYAIAFVRPDWSGASVLGEGLVYLGAICTMLSFLSLGKRMGIVPANRGIQTKGLYRYVRHPMYTSNFLSLIGYLLTHTTLYNSFVVSLAAILFLWRVILEEQHLGQDPVYEQYKKQVRFRFIPFVL